MAKKLTIEEFIIKAKKVHGSKYNYSKVNYINKRTAIKIICEKHGIFKQLHGNHLAGSGCKKCCNNTLYTKNIFLDKVNEKHKYIYNYEKLDYKNNSEKIIVTCKLHGDFNIRAGSHLEGVGCKKCASLNLSISMRRNPTGWTKTNWGDAGLKSKYFESFKVYVIEIKENNEHFYKIGRTFLKIGMRFNKFPYNYKIIKIFTGTATEMFDLENELKRKNKEYKYVPKLKFDGMYECFKTIKNKEYVSNSSRC